MNEEETTQEESEATVENKDDGNIVKTTPLIDIANAAAERMEKANEETARLQNAQGERDARIALGGRSEAGQEIKEKEETDEEYAARFEKGEVNPLKDDGII